MDLNKENNGIEIIETTQQWYGMEWHECVFDVHMNQQKRTYRHVAFIQRVQFSSNRENMWMV